MIGDKLEIYTYDYLLQMALSNVSNSVDKRQGSIIFDTLSPFCYRMADIFMQLRNFYQDTFAETSGEQYLDYRVREQGITRYAATKAIKKGYFASSSGSPMAVNIGSRFSTVSDTKPLNYVVTSVYTVEGVVQPGYYQLTCESEGTQGNEYSGNLINITFIQGLAEATMSDLIQPARDTETDDDLRKRYFDVLEQKAFGGNIADYRKKTKEINGVGEVQIYPVWDGGGTVKLSIIDPEYNRCTPDFVALVQEEIDPENAQGETGTGLGMAPIDHRVTVVTPDELVIDVIAQVTLMNGFTIGQVQPEAEQAIQDYFLLLRKNWAVGDNLNRYAVSVYRSRIVAALLTVAGISNVSGVQLNGEEEDIELAENGSTQQIPVMGTVTLNE